MGHLSPRPRGFAVAQCVHLINRLTAAVVPPLETIMKPRLTFHSFRKIAAAEETMIRAMMPRTNEADPPSLAPVSAPIGARVWRDGRLVVDAPLTATLQEVARG